MLFSGNKTVKTVVEEAAKEDFLRLSEIHGEGFRRAWSDGEIESLLRKPGYHCFVARQSGKLVGFVLFTSVEDEGEVITIVTVRQARKSGIAATLLKSAIEFLKTSGVKSLFLEVEETNGAALRLYSRFKFEKVGERKAYYQSGKSDEKPAASALVMRLQVG